MTSRMTIAAAVVVVGLASVGMAVMARGGGPTAATKDTHPQTDPPPGVVAAPGRVEPISEEIAVAPEVSGRLTDVLVDEGDTVTRGQVLARVANEEFTARLEAAEARLAMAEAERDRLVNGARPEERREAVAAAAQAEAAAVQAQSEMVRKRKLLIDDLASLADVERAERDARVTEARRVELTERARTVGASARADELARARAAVALAHAQAEEARALLARTVIRAPIDGVVLRRHRRAGETVAVNGLASPAVVTLADTRVLRVRVEVDESDVAHVRVGQRAWVTAGAYGAERFPGRVVRVSEMLGRKQVRTDVPSERVDTRVLETLVELDPGVRLPIAFRVDAFIATR